MCDLTDPRILETYTAIIDDQPTNWLILGYNDTRDVISLYSSGTEGLSEFRDYLSDEVLYGFVRMDDRFILITWVSEQVSGVRRARALVHSRSVAAVLKDYHAQITATTLNDLSEASIRTRLKLGDGKEVTSRRSSSNLNQKRASRRMSTQSPIPTSPTSAVPPPFDEFVEAHESLPATPIEPAVDYQALEKQRQAEEQQKALLAQQQRQAETERQKAAEVERLAVAAAAAEKEAKRLAAAAEKEAQEKRNRQLQEEEEKKKRIQREKLEAAQRLEEEKRALQRQLLQAEKNKDVILSGYVSVQPMTSPFWRRRYFTIKGKSMAFYRDELQSTPMTVLDLNNVTRLNSVNVDIETFVPNAFVLETKQNGSWKLFADDKKGLQTILTALQTVI